jgi:peptidoglycan/xylan/chitin deacetylase (PgdA/CDA1 family)
MVPTNELIENLKEQNELWDIFTRKEEYNPLFLDKYERFPYHLSNYRKIFSPLVSRYLLENGFKPEYPDGKKFAVCLTHDIDITNEGYLRCAVNSVKSTFRGNLSDAVKYPIYAINKKKHPYWNFHEIMKLEEKYGAKSSFYFLALEPREVDYTYDLQSIRDDIRLIDAKGWEVGLHGGHESYKNLEDIVTKKRMIESILGKEVVGYRNHYLRFKVPDTWELLSKAGFKYDTTFGYADCVGFRNGMCHPFKPFNLNTGKQIDILEIPLVIMDNTLLKDYMRLDFEKAWELTKQLIDCVKQCRGVITVLWHNNSMQGEKLQFYEKLLKYCQGEEAWMTSGNEIERLFNV